MSFHFPVTEPKPPPSAMAAAPPWPRPSRPRSGSSITFDPAGIFGASLAPYIATWLQASYGINYAGYYLLAASPPPKPKCEVWA